MQSTVQQKFNSLMQEIIVHNISYCKP